MYIRIAVADRNDMWGFRKLTLGKFDWWQVSGIAVF
jgi:hypothetical protein